MRPQVPRNFMRFRNERRTMPGRRVAIAASRTKLAELLGFGGHSMAASVYGLASSRLSNFRVPEIGQPHSVLGRFFRVTFVSMSTHSYLHRRLPSARI
jgi:hypothetical protein